MEYDRDRVVVFRAPVAYLVIAGLLAACVGEGANESAADPTQEDAVECRELGGGFVYIHYDSPGGPVRAVRLGLPGEGEGVSGDVFIASTEDVSADDEAEARRLRDRNGWDDAAVRAVLQEEATPERQRRLEQMPSCLEVLRDR